MQSLKDCSVFFRIHARRCGFVLIRLGCSGFGRSQAVFWTVLGNMSSSATKEAKLVVNRALTLLGGELSIFPKFQGKVRSGGLLLFRSGALALGRARVIVLLLGLQRTFAGLVVRLGRVRLLFSLVSRGSRSTSFMGYFTVSFPVLCIDSLDEFLEAGKSVWLLMVDHVIFDTFGESIVSLSAECCLAPLNVCG